MNPVESLIKFNPVYSAYKALDRNKPGTPETRRAANTYLPGYGPAGGAGERRPATNMLTGG
jgi:hypothetical protein